MKTAEDKRIYLADYYKRNAEIIKARSSQRYHSDPKAAIAKQSVRRKVNPEAHNITNRAWREGNLEKARKSGREWAKRNLEYRREQERKRRAKLNGFEPYTESQVLELYGSICHLCGLQIDLDSARRVGRKGWETGLHIEHLIAIANGGSDTLGNVRPAHGLCNIKKGAK